MKRTLGNQLRAGALAMAAMLLPVNGATAWCAAAEAASYPTRPVRLVVPFPAGGTTDIFARLVADRLSRNFGQQFFVENIGGAGGNIGSASVARAEPDGYSLVVGASSTHAINPTLYKRMPYDALRDFVPVASLAAVPNVMVVNPKNVKATSVEAFVVEAKASPRRFNMASSGNGTSIHLAGELFKQMTGVEMPHVPYRGSGPAVNDLVGGQVDVMFDNLPFSIEQVRAGNLRALAVTSRARSPALPNVPTVIESGLDGFEATSWFALFAPKGTPAPIVARLNAEVIKILQAPDVQQRFAGVGGEVRPMTPEELRAFVQAELEKWAKVVVASGATID